MNKTSVFGKSITSLIGRSLIAIFVLSFIGFYFGLDYLLMDQKSANRPQFSGAYKSLTWYQTPKPLPDYIFEAKTDDAVWRPQSLNQYKGQVVILNFWASWCAPCIEELPSFNQLQAKFNPDKVKILAVNLDTAKDMPDAKKIWNQLGLNHLTLSREILDAPLNQKAIHRFFIEAFPSTFVIDRSGKMVATLLGDANWASKDAEQLVRWLIG